MKHEEPSFGDSLEQRLLQLLQTARDKHDASARAELNTLLRDNVEARSVMARLMVDEQPPISRLRDDSIMALLEPSPATVTPPTMPPLRRHKLVRMASAHGGGSGGNCVWHVLHLHGVWVCRAFVGKGGVALAGEL